MTLVKWEPFRDLLNLQERMNRLFEDSLVKSHRGEEEFTVSSWIPAVDIYETDKELILKADLPDIEQKDVEIQIQDNILTLKGERKFEKKIKEENYQRIERSYGTFTRSFTLPKTIEQEKVKAKMKNGVLEVVMPKKAEDKSKQVKIEVE